MIAPVPPEVERGQASGEQEGGDLPNQSASPTSSNGRVPFACRVGGSAL